VTSTRKPAWHRRRNQKPRWRRDYSETRYLRFVRAWPGSADEVMVLGSGAAPVVDAERAEFWSNCRAEQHVGDLAYRCIFYDGHQGPHGRLVPQPTWWTGDDRSGT
jgi:hypothetical protein